MFISIISIFLFIVFFLLGILHFYWASGGKWGFDEALPSNLNGKRVLNPKKIDCIIIGLGLTSFGIFYLIQSGIAIFTLPFELWVILRWLIPVIFALRAIGDFRYAGFFKSIRSTCFAQLDSKYYSPLCLVISILGFLILFY